MSNNLYHMVKKRRKKSHFSLLGLFSIAWCMHKWIFFKCVFRHECFIAFGTSVCLLSSVDSWMLFQFVCLGTWIGTNITLVWLLFSVDHHMLPKLGLLIWCRLTLTAPESTLVRFFLTLDTDVSLEITCIPKCLQTFFALIILFATMDKQVLL